jgi:hypothetical protein
MKINSIYKQASIERQSTKKRDIKEINLTDFDNPMIKGPAMENLLI